VLVAVTALTLGVVVFGPATPAHADPAPSCEGLAHGQGDGSLTKTFVSQTDNGDGTITLRFILTTDEADGEARVLDCAWVDSTENRSLDKGEPITSSEQVVTFTNHQAEISITVQAEDTDQICDRAGSSHHIDQGGGAQHRSNISCNTDEPGNGVVPEAPMAVLLPASAFALLGLFAFSRRRSITRNGGAFS
jgi:hypothetical protein